MTTNKTANRREVTAAVVRDKGGAFQVEQASIGEPGPREVLVRVIATGVCHTDILVRDQNYPSPLPAVLGHEGSGVVEAGDHVVMSFMSCGFCRSCEEWHPAHCENFSALNFAGGRADGSTASYDRHGHALHDHFFGQSSFSTYAMAHERNIVKVPKEAPLELLGPLGCGIQTGAGAVLNALKVPAGASFAVFGAGAVGLSAVMAARLAGAARIIAVDVTPSRLDLAKRARRDACGEQPGNRSGRRRTGDHRRRRRLHAREQRSAGRSEAGGRCARNPWDLRNRRRSEGRHRSRVRCDAVMLPGKRIMGIVEGDSVPQVIIPHLVELFLQGRFPFDKLVKFYPLEEINRAIADSEKGTTIKPVLRLAA
jgi:aryl-alcohol dehydrogenase